MKPRDTSPGWLVIRRMLLCTALVLTCLIALLSYALFGRGQTIQLQRSKSQSFEMERLMADARTVVAAISYLLEPEPACPIPSSPYNPNVQTSQILLGQASNRPGSNDWSRVMTNHPSPG